jgi:hypothetical protein
MCVLSDFMGSIKELIPKFLIPNKFLDGIVLRSCINHTFLLLFTNAQVPEILCSVFTFIAIICYGM